MAVKLGNILNLLTLQLNNSEEDNERVDYQFRKIFSIIEKHFDNNEFEIVLDWFHESVKKEKHLKEKIQRNPFVYDKPSIHLLISKTNALHSKIIELVVDKIDQVMFDNDQDMRVIFDLAQTFISNLTINRHIDEDIYDNHIKILAQAMEIFNLV
jgi:hypothetical protein